MRACSISLWLSIYIERKENVFHSFLKSFDHSLSIPSPNSIHPIDQNSSLKSKPSPFPLPLTHFNPINSTKRFVLLFTYEKTNRRNRSSRISSHPMEEKSDPTRNPPPHPPHLPAAGDSSSSSSRHRSITVDTATPDPHRKSSSLPNFKVSVKLKYVKLGYHYVITKGMYVALIPLVAITSANLSSLRVDDVVEIWDVLKLNMLTTAVCSVLMVFLATVYFMSRPRKVYLVDFACYKPDSALMTPREVFMDRTVSAGSFSDENVQFQKKIIERSGLGQRTYFPDALIRKPPNPCMSEARKEAETVMFGAIDQLLVNTGVRPKDIGILIVNCSLFNPTPSLSAMIVNHYNLRGNVQSFNLGGMGCSAGLISIDLAKQLLQVHTNAYALVVSTENITLNWYWGNDRSMLLSNCLFRMGGAAILLSNKRADRGRSKYQLVHTVRTHKGSDDRAYGCVFQREDGIGKVGVSLSKDLMAVAGEALKANITTLGPLVLPMSEQMLFFATLVARKVLRMKIKPYIPDFKLAFEHFCIHAGGRAVLDELEKNLELSEWHMEPSRMTLYRFGNTSSSSLWYELAYAEAKGRIRKGDRTWQIAFGSGFKCNSAVWKALIRVDPVKEEKKNNPWMDEIQEFPVEVPRIAAIGS